MPATTAPPDIYLCRWSNGHYEAKFTHTIVTQFVAD